MGEDVLWDNSVVELLEDHHSFTLESYKRHVRYKGFEFDVVSYWRTQTGRPRVIIAELKETDFNKVIEQALLRQPYADYTYVIVHLSLRTILSTSSFAASLCKALQHGVGVITYLKDYGGEPELWVPAKYKRQYGLIQYSEGVSHG